MGSLFIFWGMSVMERKTQRRKTKQKRRRIRNKREEKAKPKTKKRVKPNNKSNWMKNKRRKMKNVKSFKWKEWNCKVERKYENEISDEEEELVKKKIVIKVNVGDGDGMTSKDS